MKKFSIIGIVFFAVFLFVTQSYPQAKVIKNNSLPRAKVKQSQVNFPLNLPKDWQVSIYARDLGNPRDLISDQRGRLLVSIPKKGQVVALIDKDGDQISDQTKIIAQGLNLPHGLALNCPGVKCQLYVAETDQVAVYDYDETKITLKNRRKLFSLPGGGSHFTRSLLIHDNQLFTSIGSSCNVCLEKDIRRAKIYVSDLDGKNLRQFASGLRNSVFLISYDRQIWATEMGRDNLGDELPPDEINIIRDGLSYGWPICYGKGAHDLEFDKNVYEIDPCLAVREPSLIDIPAHSAPLGLAFIPKKSSWPKAWQGDLLVAYHGSWNRTQPTGYKLVRWSQKSGKWIGKDFITGWLNQGKVHGRPVDIEILGNSIYISDDSAGLIYRVSKKL